VLHERIFENCLCYSYILEYDDIYWTVDVH